MPTPILAPNHTWFSQGGTTVKRASITQIDIKDSYTPTGTVTSSWDASAAKDGSVMAYVEGTKLTIAGNGSGKVYANADSSYVFSNSGSDKFGNVETINGADILDTSNATVMNHIFYLCQSLKTVDTSGWNTGAVQNMWCVFAQCYSLENALVENWDVSNVTNMRAMFQGATSLTVLDLGRWNVGKVESMYGMFMGHSSFPKTPAIREVRGLENWDVSSVTTTEGMFSKCDLLQYINVSNWDVSSVTNMQNMFNGCSALTELNVSNWDVGNVTDMSYMFNDCFALTELDVSNWDVSKVTDMCSMFSGANYGATKWQLRELDVSKWNPSSCTDFSFMFYGLNGAYNKLTLDVGGWDVSKGENFDHMTAHSYITLNGIENWYTPAATNMNAMFYSIQNPVIDVSNLVTDNVYVFGQMFEACTNTEEIIGLNRFNTANGVDFGEMFLNCAKLKKLDLSSFDTRKAKDGVTVGTNGGKSACMLDMIGNTHRLEEIRLGENVSFDGDGTTTNASHRLTFPTPNSSYISGADGNWYTIDKEAIAPSAVTEGAGTYFATPAAADAADHEPMLVAHGSMLRTAQSLREIGGSVSGYYPSEFHGVVDEANEEITGQSELLEQLTTVLAEKATPSGGIDLDSFKSAWMYGGLLSYYWAHIAFAEGMTWAEFIESPLNAGVLDYAGPAYRLDPMLRAYNGRVCTVADNNPPMYLARNNGIEEWTYGSSPQSGDVVVSTDDLIVAGELYWIRRAEDWNT